MTDAERKTELAWQRFGALHRERNAMVIRAYHCYAGPPCGFRYGVLTGCYADVMEFPVVFRGY